MQHLESNFVRYTVNGVNILDFIERLNKINNSLRMHNAIFTNTYKVVLCFYGE